MKGPMYKFLTIALLAGLPSTSRAVDFDFSLGWGTQYGLIGTQLAVNHNDSKYYVSLGLPSASVGIKTQFEEDKNKSWGGNVGKIFGIFSSDINFASLNYNYHFNGFHNSGWEIGLGISYVQQDSYTPWGSSEQTEDRKGPGLSISLGYSF